MDDHRFDTMVKPFATAWSRHAIVRGAAAFVGGLASGAATVGGSRAADEVPPPPPASFILNWPVCSAERPHYCVDAFTVDGQDQLAGDAPAYITGATGLSDPDTSGLATNVNWQVNRFNDDPLCDIHTLAGCGRNLEDADLDNELYLIIRTGRLKPFLSYLESGITRVRVTGSEATGWETEIRGYPGVLAAPYPLQPTRRRPRTRALHSTARGTCAKWPPDGQPFEGMLAVTTYGWTYPEWVDEGWEVRLSSPHVLPGGSVNHGCYAAWLAPANLQRMSLTAEQALAGDLTSTRTDEGVGSPVEVSISELAGGVFIAIPDLTFSSPTIIMKKREGGSDSGGGDGEAPHKCPKHKVYKHGRCVRKHKHKKKGKGKKH